MNYYEIKGDYVEILLKRRTGQTFITLIDTEDLPLLLDLNLSWHVSWDNEMEGYYARATKYISLPDGKHRSETHYLHRVITNAPKGSHVDHKNHNLLDNRKCNLVVTDASRNTKNRLGANKNSKTGHRNVAWSKWEQAYIVQLSINKKNTRLGKFSNLEEAVKFAEEMRKKYYRTA
ncbi:hypothetical protein [Brevibacillus sp. NRS-1366]|uniref:hypothetical protein n=1 Tax=Brevibacillus sp. NRS-1366 TaxID=3233899 RepID=UPI003D251D6D